MNKQELIDKLVRRYDGEYPASEYLDVDENITRYHSGEYWFESGSIRVSKKEFQQRARELGYGVEAAKPEGWYCYETQKALRLPPVGEVCKMYAAALWFDVKMIAEDDGKPIVKYMDCGNYYPASPAEKFYRPLDHETRKAEAERKRVVDAAAAKFHASIMPDYSGQPFIDGLSALYDAGFLRMPEDK